MYRPVKQTRLIELRSFEIERKFKDTDGRIVVFIMKLPLTEEGCTKFSYHLCKRGALVSLKKCREVAVCGV